MEFHKYFPHPLSKFNICILYAFHKYFPHPLTKFHICILYTQCISQIFPTPTHKISHNVSENKLTAPLVGSIYSVPHQVIIDNVDMLEFSVSTEYLLQIFLRRVETETKHPQDITGTRVELRRGGEGEYIYKRRMGKR